MRQAGRYMQSYRDVRKKYSFEQICFTPELCVEVSLQPVRTFDFDAAILFSDILFPLRVLNIDVDFSDQGPTLTQPEKGILLPVAYEEALSTLFHPLYSSAKVLQKFLDRPLIGFAGAPFTLAAFLIEGKGQTNWPMTKKTLLHDPSRLRALFPMLEKIVIAHLKFQIEAGCSAVQIFDSLSWLVPAHLRDELILKPLNRILASLPRCPVIYYKATKDLLNTLPKIPLSLGEDIDLTKLAKDRSRVFQGNLDASLLQHAPQKLALEIKRICTLMHEHPGFIFNLSSGVPQDTSEDTIKLLVNTVREQHDSCTTPSKI
jgi:uroporphyrinogen decarboxylase